MTMILIYVSSQSVPESAIEDDGTKNNQLKYRCIDSRSLHKRCLRSERESRSIL